MIILMREHPDYGVTETGEVWSFKRHPPQMLKLQKMKRGGYLKVELCTGGSQKTCRVDHLVLKAHVGDKPEGANASCHWDGNPTNNHVDNLYWGTDSENQIDRLRHGTHNTVKLTPAIVREIRNTYATGQYTQTALAAEYGLRQDHVSDVVRRVSWKHVK